MHAERKNEWKCHNCRKSKLPNPPTVASDETIQQKQQRDEDDDNEEQAKRFKDSLSLNLLNSKLGSVQSDVNEIKTTMQTLAQNINISNTNIREDLQNALATITSAIANLTTQVNDIQYKNDENNKQIYEMNTRINKLEQQAINKNIEINNVQNQQMSADEVIKKIATSLNAFRLKINKIIVEFCSINKKREVMEKIHAHRIDANVLNVEETNETDLNTNNYIYVNDQLTANNRRLLWLAKTKAKECNWKYVWVKNGSIFARKIENATAIVINNAADIEAINQSMSF